jgi:hypothetical protein
MIRYHEMLRRKLKETNTDVLTFFRAAYCYKFGCDANLTQDVIDYRDKAIIPVYVRQFLENQTG